MHKKTTTLSLLVVAAASVLLAGCGNSTTTQNLPTSAPNLTEGSSTSEKTANIVAKYDSPAGEEQVGFSLVVNKEGIITSAKTDVLGKAPASKMRQEAFSKEMSSALVGKKLADLSNIDRLGGSSLTTGAFNKSLSALKSQVM